MSYTFEDLMRDNVRDALHLLSPEDVIGAFDVDALIQQLPRDKVMNAFAPEDIIRQLPPDKVVQSFAPHDLMKHVPQDALLRNNILNLLGVRFPLNAETIQHLNSELDNIEDTTTLQQLLIKAGQIETLEAFIADFYA